MNKTEAVTNFLITFKFETNLGAKIDTIFDPLNLQELHNKIGISPLKVLFSKSIEELTKINGEGFILKVTFVLIKKKYHEPKYIETVASDNLDIVYKSLIFGLLNNIKYTTLSSIDKMKLTHYLTTLSIS
jgi:hypothetical protein